MFKHRHEQSPVPTDAIDHYQVAADQKTQAHDIFMQNWHDLQLAQVHPWHTSNEQLIGMAEAAIAYSNDRLAEILQSMAQQTDRRGNTTLTPDVYDFVLALSQNAHRNIAAAQDWQRSGSPRTLNSETIANLNPEAMLPYWPQEPSGAFGEQPEWQGRQTAQVTPDFVRGVFAATKELQGDVYHYLGEYESIRVMATPPEYASLDGVVKDYLLQPAAERLTAAEGLLTLENLSPEALATAYRDVHDAYIPAARAFTAVFCPAILGDGTPEGGWQPNRTEA